MEEKLEIEKEVEPKIKVDSYYIEKVFPKIEKTGKSPFNFWAAFFTMYWLGYKGLLKELFYYCFPFSIVFCFPSDLFKNPIILVLISLVQMIWLIFFVVFFGKKANRWYYNSYIDQESQINPSRIMRGIAAMIGYGILLTGVQGILAWIIKPFV